MVLNLTAVSGDLQARYFTGYNPSTAATGTAASGGTGTQNATVSGTGIVSDQWMHLRLDVTTSASRVTMALNVYNSTTLFDATTLKASFSYAFSVANSASYLSGGQIGYRTTANTTGGVTALDNFAVYDAGTAPVPEPSSVALLVAGIGACGLLLRRRSK